MVYVYSLFDLCVGFYEKILLLKQCLIELCCLVSKLCPTLCDPMGCSPSSSSVHGIFQARILEWVAISFSRGSSRPRDQTRVSRIGGRPFNLWATREAFSQFLPKTWNYLPPRPEIHCLYSSPHCKNKKAWKKINPNWTSFILFAVLIKYLQFDSVLKWREYNGQ